MKPLENFGFNLFAWIVLMVLYVALLVRTGCQNDLICVAGCAIGVVGLVQAGCDYMEYRRRR